MTTCLPFSKAEIKSSLVTRFERVVGQFPEQIALKSGQQCLTYRALNEASNRLARAILQRQAESLPPVGLFFAHEADAMVAILGALKAGQVFVPLSPEFPLTRLRYMVEDTQARLIVTNSQHLSQVLDLVPNVEQILNLDELDQSISNENLARSIPNDAPACIFYTSGSTGEAKGVVWPHHYLLHYVWQNSADIQIGVSDRYSLLFPFNVGASMSDIFGAFLNGATLSLFNPRQKTLTELKIWLQQEKISFFHPSVALFRRLMNDLTDKDYFPQLRAIILGGDVLRRRDVAQFRKQCTGGQAEQSGTCLLVNRLAGTEMGLVARLNIDHATEIKTPIAPVGYPVTEKEVMLLDENGQQVFDGVGEIAIRSPYLSLGYWRKPELTATKFLPDPEGGDKRIYLTGDLGRMRADGMLEHLGRKDLMVKIRGYRVELGAIEGTLLEFEGIKEAVVVVQEKPNGEKRLVAYLVPSTQNVPVLWTVSSLHQALSQSLPDYMVPSLFVYLDALPLTPSGKIDRLSLPKPDNRRPELDTPYAPPRDAYESQLVALWEEVLGIKGIGIHDNFFELGGHSLLAMQIISRVIKALSVEIPLRTLFEAPTVAKMAETIVKKTGFSLANPQSIHRRDKSDPCLASFTQQRFWFLHQLEPEAHVYNMPKMFEIRDEGFNVEALEQALNAIVARHEVLRTTFRLQDGELVQVISDDSLLELPIIDLRLTDNRKQTLQQWIEQGIQRPFDLSSDLMLRATLFRLAETEYVLLLVTHHIASDNWSSRIFLRELTHFYDAFSTIKPPSLPELPIPYADFALWQQKQWKKKGFKEQLAYWKEQLADIQPVHLPTDHPRPAKQSDQGARQSLFVEEKLTEALKALSRRSGVTLFMTLLSAFKVLLMRYTSQEDICVGTPIAGRQPVETENLLGCFINTLLLRTQVEGELTFSSLLQRVRSVALDAYAHQELPFEKLVEELQPERNLGHTPLFQVLFNFPSVPQPAIEVSSARSASAASLFRPLKIDNQTSAFDLTLNVREEAEGLTVEFEYKTDLFEAATIKRMAGHFQTLLEGIVANPETPISELPLLTEAERHQLLYEWNDTATDYPSLLGGTEGGQCVHQLFEAQVERTPDAVAVVFSNQQLTYRELNQQANQLAHELRTLQVGPDILVGICLSRSPEMVVGVLAILKAGGAYVPLDPEYPKERLAFMLEETQAPLILTERALTGIFEQYQGHLLCLDSKQPLMGEQKKENPSGDATSSNLGYVIYTSGSTGKPKGIALPHRALVNLICWQLSHSKLTGGIKSLQYSSLSFDASFTDIFMALCAGGTLMMISESIRLEPPRLADFIASEGLSKINLPVVVLQQLAEAATQPSYDFKLKEVLSTAEQLQITPAIRKLFNLLEGAELQNQYGPAETHVVTALTLKGSPDEWPALPPIGRPIANTQIYILDEKMQPVPIGVTGELYIGGDGLARGYLNRPELTAAKFIPNPISVQTSTRLYKTGDLARYLPDGNIEFLGRIDHQVKIRGFRIELGEIEAALNSHPEVSEAVVVVRESERGDKQLVAYVVSQAAPSVLRTHLASKLPNYMLPSFYVQLEALPLTPNGKIDRRALPKPDMSSARRKQTFIAPRSAIERQLAGIWE